MFDKIEPMYLVGIVVAILAIVGFMFMKKGTNMSELMETFGTKTTATPVSSCSTGQCKA